MIGWLAAASAFAFGAVNDTHAPGAIPPMELHLRQADAAGLLYVLAEMHESSMLVVRPPTDVRVTFEHERMTPLALRNELGSQMGLRATRIGSLDVWVPACASPEYRPVGFPEARKLTMRFNNVQAAVLFILIAEDQGLEISAPDGYPSANVEVHIENLTAEEIATAVAGALNAELKIIGKTLEVRPAASTSKCSASRYKWAKEEETTPPEGGYPQLFFGNKNCGRVVKYPASAATPCRWYESFPLSVFQFRGYVKLTPRGSRLAYVESNAWSPPLLVPDGERFSEDFVAVTDVGTDAVLLAQYEQREGRKRVVKRAMSVTYADGRSQDREATSDDGRQSIRSYFERYGLEDLLVVSAQQEKERWRAEIKTVHGLTMKVDVGEYVGSNSGRIIAIDANGLEVDELIEDPSGAWYEHRVRLQKGVWYERPRDVLRRRLALPEIDTKLQSQFVRAASQGDLAALAELADKGANIDATIDKYNALFSAIRWGDARNLEVVQWLLERGARTNALLGKYEWTPLGTAAERGDLKMVELLLGAGADPNLGDVHGWTPLYNAAREGHTQVVELLISHRADTRAVSDLGLTPYLIAAYQGQVEVVKLLMRTGISLEDSDRNGQTMLYAAAMGDELELARYLIDIGADVNARDRWGKSILDMARKNGVDGKLVALLLSKGAKPGSARNQASSK